MGKYSKDQLVVIREADDNIVAMNQEQLFALAGELYDRPRLQRFMTRMILINKKGKALSEGAANVTASVSATLAATWQQYIQKSDTQSTAESRSLVMPSIITEPLTFLSLKAILEEVKWAKANPDDVCYRHQKGFEIYESVLAPINAVYKILVQDAMNAQARLEAQ